MMMGAPPAVEAIALTKRFGATQALDGVSLTIASGTVYGLLGPNGAGKTTTVRILATLLGPDRGHARIMGYDVVAQADAVRRRLSLAGQAATVDDDLTGSENLVLLGRLNGLRGKAARKRAAELLAAFGLDKSAARQVKTYSGGMRRRIDLAASLVAPADVYLLDEPTTGLDPASRAQVHQLIGAIAMSGATVLLTTQYLEEADRLADRIAVIDRGRLIAEGTPAELKAMVSPGTLRIRLATPARRPDAEQMLTELLGSPVLSEAHSRVLTASVPAGQAGQAAGEQVTAVLSKLAGAGIAMSEFTFGQASLDEVFLALTGHTRSTGQTTTETIS